MKAVAQSSVLSRICNITSTLAGGAACLGHCVDTTPIAPTPPSNLRHLAIVPKLKDLDNQNAACKRSHLSLDAQHVREERSPSGLPLTFREEAEPVAAAWLRSGAANVMDGKREAAAWLEEMRGEVAMLTRLRGRRPGLRVILVGSRPDSRIYVEKKEEACAEIGIDCGVQRLPADISQAELQAAVQRACDDAAVDGVLVQLPLPRHLDEEKVMECVDPRKDVDGFHPLNIGRILARGIPPRFVPATPLGCVELLDRCGVSVPGKHAVILGDSNIVGMPLAMLLRDAGAATVTVCHRVAFSELFAERDARDSSATRATAAACLPQLPGPQAAHARPPRSYRWLPPRRAAAAPPPLAPVQDAAAGAGAAEGASDVAVSVERCTNRGGEGAVLRVEASHAPGLVHCVTSALHDLHEDVLSARVDTEGAVVRGEFVSVARDRRPADDGARLTRIRRAVRSRLLGVPPSPAEVVLEEIPKITRTADVLVVAVGFPELVKADWVKKGAVVLDVGINVKEALPDEDGTPGEGAAAGADGPSWDAPFRVVGDVAFDEVQPVASAITPVPGGVGPMTIAAVMHNVILAARYSLGLTKW